MSETIPGLLRRTGRLFGSKAALDCVSDGPVGFDRLDVVAARFAKALLADGMAHGELGSTVTEEEIIEWCRNNLSTYKVPRGVGFVGNLPMNATGKVVRSELRKRWAANEG